MGKRQFNHQEALQQAFTAIAALRLEGNPTPPITEVSRRSGVDRSTLQSNHPDWIRVRQIAREGLAATEVTEATARLESQMAWHGDLDWLERQIAGQEEEIQRLKDVADSIYATLLAQLHKYVVLSKKMPEQRKQDAQTLKEVTELRAQCQQLKDELANLRLQRSAPANLRTLSRREVLNVYEGLTSDALADANLLACAIDAANRIDGYFDAGHEAKIPTIVYITCGCFAAGKSRWIRQHESFIPGVNLYIDGTNHTAAIRMLLLKRIKHLAPHCPVVCVLFRTSFERCLLNNDDPVRVRNKVNLPQTLIRQVADDFEPVSLDEGFNQVIMA